MTSPGRSAAPGAARDLGQELERALGGAEVGKAEPDVGVDHADQRHAREVVALGDHLRAHQDVGLARLEGGEHAAATAPRRTAQVAVEALDARRGQRGRARPPRTFSVP